jgi:hypothetical protein
MNNKLFVCDTPSCTFAVREGTNIAPQINHTKETGHKKFKAIRLLPTNLKEGVEVRFDRIRWNIEEATLDSAVFNNFVDNTQTITARVILQRKIK